MIKLIIFDLDGVLIDSKDFHFEALNLALGKEFEISKDEEINVGLMKELTGGDKIIARGLNKDPIEFKPQFLL